jgi:transposase
MGMGDSKMRQQFANVTTIGLDLAKHVFQVHGIDREGRVIIRKPLRRKNVISFFQELPRCLVGMEACATAHFWARELQALGHEVRLIAPAYVKAYVKRGKNDAADAAGICEAVTRPSMRFVPVKTVEQQAELMPHRTRDLLVRQRTQLINAIRGHAAELGIVSPQGREGVNKLIEIVTENARAMPKLALNALRALTAQLKTVQGQIMQLEKAIQVQHSCSSASQRLETIPGIGDFGCHSCGGNGPRPLGLQVWTRVRGLDRACASAKLDGRQGAARLDFQARRPLFAQAACGRLRSGAEACA